MRKFIFAFVVVAGCTMAIQSCKKETTKVAFNHSIKADFFDVHCKSCHQSGGPNASSWLYDPSDYEGSIKTHLTHIYEQVDGGYMPPQGGLTIAELDAFDAWFFANGPASN